MSQDEQFKGEFLRTVVRVDVLERLRNFAKQYTTGAGKWDYGVAIQALLDFYEQNSSVAQINMKLDAIASMIQSEPVCPVDSVPEENQGTTMLGGEVIRK